MKPLLNAIAPWFGSNRMLAPEVGRVMGRMKWIGVPFAGGMSELFQLDARTIIANDLHKHVINMAIVIADPILGPQLYRRLRRMVMHADVLDAAQNRCEAREANPPKMPDLEWANDYFVCSWMSRSHSAGSIDEFRSGMSLRWNANGGDSAVRFFNAAKCIPQWRRMLSHCTFISIDALEFLGSCNDEAGNGIYCDPPFPGPGNRYKHRVDEAFQRRLAEAVSRFEKTRVVMRFYDHPLIREIYYADPRWIWHHFEGRTQANKAANEVLIVNQTSGSTGLFIPEPEVAA